VLDAALAASLAAIPNGSAETKGVAVGAEVAAGILALRANDHRNDIVGYEFGSGPGVYQPHRLRFRTRSQRINRASPRLHCSARRNSVRTARRT
jgi:hypothetical protein